MILPGQISHFDEAVVQRKKALRFERWNQILRFKRKPNKIQAQILREDLRGNLIILGIIAILAYLLT